MLGEFFLYKLRNIKITRQRTQINVRVYLDDSKRNFVKSDGAANVAYNVHTILLLFTIYL